MPHDENNYDCVGLEVQEASKAKLSSNLSLVIEARLLRGRVVRKLLNVNPGLNLNYSIIFSCLEMFFTYNVWCSLRLLELKTEGQTVFNRTPHKKLQN